MPRHPLLLATSLLLLASGCGGAGDFPSLAPRAVERELGDLPPATGPCAVDGDGCALPAPTAAPPADDAALRTRIAEIEEQVRQARLAFDAAVPRVREAANRAGAYGLEGWTAAQQQLSRLEATRGPIVTAVAALDALALERATVPTTEADQSLLAAAIAETERIDALQREELAQIGAVLRPQ